VSEVKTAPLAGGESTAGGPRRSRRGVRGAGALALAVALAAGAGCTSGAPPGFAAGADRWTFPLVGPLEGGLLITPVMLNSHGPYLFLIDPDAPLTIIDVELVKAAGLRPISGPPRLDESDTQRARAYAELTGMEIGTLILERREVMVLPSHANDVAGRRIHGVLGRDVFADSVAFGFDRDRGLAHLVTQSSFRPPAGAATISYALLEPRIANAQVQPVPRRLVRATIGGESFSLHVDLGAAASQLREGLWPKAKLVARDLQAAVVDEVGSVRRVTRVSELVTATVGGSAGSVAFVPYGDKRWEEQDIAGTLGIGFFAGYGVWASWHTKTLYLAARRPIDAPARIARWESPVLSKCPNPGCIAIRLVDPLAGKPPAEGKPHPGVVLSITRDERAGGMGLEVTLEAQGEARLPYLIVNLPSHVDRLIHQLKPDFLGKTVVVVDASPFPRACPGTGGCVDQLAR